MDYDIYTWNDIKSDFSDNIILGNGASMAVHSGFKYSNLYTETLKKKKIPPEIQEIFYHFKITDFEEETIL